MTLPTALVGLLGCIVVVGAPFVLVALTPPIVSRAEFEALKPGMDPAAAARVIGYPGREKAIETTGESRRRTIAWVNADGSTVTAVFENELLVSKLADHLR